MADEAFTAYFTPPETCRVMNTNRERSGLDISFCPRFYHNNLRPRFYPNILHPLSLLDPNSS